MSEAGNESVLSPEEQQSLSCLLDLIIPPRPDGRVPGAGALGLVASIEEAIRKSPDLRPAVVGGLAALAEVARERGAGEFAALCDDDRLQALNQVAASAPAFLPGLIFHTYVSYYQNGRVAEALGLEARPPHPRGYELETGDLGLLEAVRRRPKMYRQP